MYLPYSNLYIYSILTTLEASSLRKCFWAFLGPGPTHHCKDHLGPKHMRSEQNVFVQQPSDKTYVLQVHLFAGDPVEYQVLVQRVGFPDIVYNLPAHQETDETVDVFSMTALQLESAWEPLELDWLRGRPLTLRRRLQLRAREEMRTSMHSRNDT